MKKLRWIIPTAIVLFLIGITLVLILCSKPKQVKNEYVPITPVATYTLDIPRNLTIENGVATWDSVPNASYYIVSIDDDEYITVDNSFDLSALKQDGMIKIKAVGEGIYLSSSKSTGMFYRNSIDSSEVDLINTKICNFMNEYITDFNLDIREDALSLYLLGFDKNNIDDLFLNIAEFIEINLNLSIGKIGNELNILYQAISDYILLEYEPFAKINGVSLLLKNYFLACADQDYDKEQTFYYSIDEIKANYRSLVTIITNFDQDTLMALAKLDNYVKTLALQIRNVKNLVGNGNFIDVDLSSDLLTLKDQMMNALLKAMPDDGEYDLIINVLCDIYDTVVPTYLKEELSSVDFATLLKVIYNYTDKITKFTEQMEDKDFQSLLKYIKAIILSVDQEKIAEIKETFSFNNIKESVALTIENLQAIDLSLYFGDELIEAIKVLATKDELTLLDLIAFLKIDSVVKFDLNNYQASLEIENLIKALFILNDLPFDPEQNSFVQFIDAFNHDCFTKIDGNYFVLLNNLIKTGAIIVDYSLIDGYDVFKPLMFLQLMVKINNALVPVTFDAENLVKYQEYYEEIKEIVLLVNKFKGGISDYSEISELLSYLAYSDSMLAQFDFIDIYNIYLLLSTKMAKFSYNYQTVYDITDNNLDYQMIFKKMTYYLMFGVNAKDAEEFFDLIALVLQDAQKLILENEEEVKNLTSKILALNDLIQNQEYSEIKTQIKDILESLNQLYEKIKDDEIIDNIDALIKAFPPFIKMIYDLEIDELDYILISEAADIFTFTIQKYERLYELVKYYIASPDELLEIDLTIDTDVKAISELYIFMFYPINELMKKIGS